MMKESLIFFALLFFVLIGFFQGFVGFDLVDAQQDKTTFIATSMVSPIPFRQLPVWVLQS